MTDTTNVIRQEIEAMRLNATMQQVITSLAVNAGMSVIHEFNDMTTMHGSEEAIEKFLDGLDKWQKGISDDNLPR